MKRIYLWLISLLSGVLLWACWPAGGFTPLVFVALVPLFWVEDYVLNRQREADAGRAAGADAPAAGPPRPVRYHIFLYSFSAFLVWNVLTTWWVWNSTPVAVFAFTANAALMAGAFSLFHYTCRYFFKKDNSRWLILCLYWLAFEHFHHHWDLSWPWLTLGNVFAKTPAWVQWYEITGPLGGSLWVLFCNVAMLRLLQSRTDFSPFIQRTDCAAKVERALARSPKSPLIIALSLILIPWAASLIRFATYKEQGRPVEVVAVQPNIDPYAEQFEIPPLVATTKMLSRAEPLMTENTRFVVSPESMIQEYVWEDDLPDGSLSLTMVYKFLWNHPGAKMIAGISSYSHVKPEDSNAYAVRRLRYAIRPEDRYYRAHNSVIAVCPDPKMPVRVHHKSRLTPGVEIMPFIGTFKFLERMAVNLGGTTGTLGPEDKPYIFGGPAETVEGGDTTHFASIICYESVFGDYVAECVNAGAELLFISTNDGWWGNTPGHRQHAAYARLRAIENRRDIARSANTGISCFIDQRGTVYQKTKYWEPAAIRQTLYANNAKTFYSRYGDILGRCSLMLSLFFLLLTFVYRIFPHAWRNQKNS